MRNTFVPTEVDNSIPTDQLQTGKQYAMVKGFSGKEFHLSDAPIVILTTLNSVTGTLNPTPIIVDLYRQLAYTYDAAAMDVARFIEVEASINYMEK
ncbi:hypothetical protein PQD74_gp067 [Stenotrophomonas phage Siara]|uniref:Uncharacterized protein n=1 Tax=Stenotrophomonas phage Siara TaxID=2859658 RepID=A0AAE8BIA7_9CAUD|nr:hypothetical protein PQD74_gp067 [Stenotrophomonas phage Siara]QYW02097.1 hypothetical protein CPT_Siara_097 [Stenotrophomonas phage Siara]